jgi:predicted nucleic acid-binding protein
MNFKELIEIGLTAMGFTPSVKILLDDIIAKAGFWVSKKVYVHTLQLAGE